MTKFQSLIAAVAAILAGPVFAHDGVHIEEAYARASGMSGAVFFVVDNHQIEDDRLIAATSEIAQKTELHTHKENADGVMQMIHVEEGFVIPAMEKFALQRGGAHVMLMGLKQDLTDGDVFKLTLTFERAGQMTVDVKVDNARKEDAGHNGHMHKNHGSASPTP